VLVVKEDWQSYRSDFAKAGADVAVCVVNVTGETFDLEGVAEEIIKLGRRSLAIKYDILIKIWC
jgi:hypothetical protein